jgi:gliding motility-associated-like protein
MRRLLFLLFALCISTLAIAQTIRTSGPTTFCEGGNVRLSLNGVNGTPTYQWTKDGNNIAGATSNTYLVTTSGSYNVILTPSSGSITPVVVTVHPKPIPDFSFPANICAETSIPFTSVVTSGTAPFSYAWDFGDGKTSTLQNPTHSFTSFGCGTRTFTVRLTVTDANGCVATLTKSVSVMQLPNIDMKDLNNPFSPFNNCNNSPAAGNAAFSIQLAFNTPSPTCATAYTVNWGDGNVQNAITAASFPLSHTYTQLGTFEVTVTATGTNGCKYSKVYKVVNQSNPAVGIETPGRTTGCAPSGFWFKLKGYELNSPGTTYTWDFDDGSQTETWTTPVTVDSIFHLFTTTSCTKPGGQYVVKVTAENGCKSTTATVDNITIYMKPKADFTTPGDACVNRPVSFTNTSTGGYNQGSCNRTTVYTWDFGDPTSSQNTSTAVSPSHTYANTGTYTVRLIAEGSCGKDTVFKTICVVNTPTASFNLDQTEACGPATVTATNTSSTLNGCSSANYQWTVTYAATHCGTAAGWSFANNTTASSVNPSFTFTNPGTYTVRLSIVTGCGTISATKTVVVKAPPRVSMAAIASACGPVTFTPTATVTNCGTSPVTYAWVIDGAPPITTTSPGSLTFSTPGAHTITLTVTNECGSTSASRSFTISAPPEMNPPANQVYCPGTPVSAHNFAGSTTGATYSWSNSNTAIGLGANGSSSSVPSFTTTNAGTATITIRSSLNGCTAQATYTITVHPRPIAPTTSPVSYCKDATASPLTATATAGYTLTWYSTSSGGTGTTTAPSPSTSTTGTTTYYVSQVNPSTGCESARAPLTVTVASAPVITNTTWASPTSCTSNNGTITLTGLTPNTSYTVSYSYNGLAVNKTIVSNSSGTLLLTTLAAGVYEQITVTRSGCSAPPIGPVTLADPNPPIAPTISNNNSPLCSGGTLTLTATGAPPSATYLWTTPSGATMTGSVINITNAQPSASGTYSVKTILNGCSSAVATTDGVIHSTPLRPTVTSNSPLCEGASLTLSANSATSGVDYAWTGPNGFTSNTQNPTLNPVTTAASGVYTATVSLGSCSVSQTTNVTIQTLPLISGASATDPTGCNTSNGSITLRGLQPTTGYAVQYSKNGAAAITVSLVTTASGELVLAGLGAGTYTDITAASGGCLSLPVGPFALQATSAPVAPTATSSAPLCSGETLQLNTTSPASGTYQWTGPNGFTSSAQNPTVPNASAAASGTYFVTVTVNGCQSPAGQVAVVVHPVPAAPDVSPVLYCLGNVANALTATPSSGNTLSWYSSASGGTAFPQTPVPLTNMAGTTLYYASQANGHGCEGPRASLSVTVQPRPIISGSRYTNPSGCSPNTGSIILEGLTANTAYTVQYSRNGNPETISIRSDHVGNITLSSLVAGTYTDIAVIHSGCTSKKVGPYSLVESTITPAVPKASVNSPVCVGESLHLFANSSTTGASYHWTGPGGFTSNEQNPTVTNATEGASGKYYVWVQLDNCLSEKDSIHVTVGRVPSAPLVASPSNYCEGQLSQPLEATASAGYNLLWYTVATGGTGSTVAPTPLTTTAGREVFYVVQKSAAGCESNRSTIEVMVQAKPRVTILGETSYCQGENVVFASNVQSQEPVHALQWSFTNGTTATGSSISQRFEQPGTYGVKLLATTAAGCRDSALHTVQIQQAPVLRGSQDVSLCLGQSAQLNVTGATVYQWTPLNNLSCSTCPDPIATPATTTQYVVEGRNAAGCRTFDTVMITVQQPSKIRASGKDSICLGNSVSLLATGAPLYHWSPAQGLSSTTIANPVATPTTTTTYMVVGYDPHHCFRDTAHVTVAVGSPPTISLGPDLTLATGTLHALTPVITNGPISRWVWTPTANLSCSNCPVPTAEIKKDISYAVEITTRYGCSAKDTINIKTFCADGQVFIPNAFSPDNDGINDILMVRASGILSVKHFRIFNRWGELVFERSNFMPNSPQYGWDGKIRGVTGGPDVFVYTCEVICENGSSFTYKGNVSIIK